MLLANVEVPDTLKLEVPAVFVMLLPLAIVKLAIVCATCRSHIDVPVIATPVDVDKLPVNFKVPAEIVVPPVYVLAPDSVNVPAPAFVKLTPVPPMMPLIVLAPPLVTDNAPFVAKVIAGALNTSVVIVKPVNAVVPPTAPLIVTSPVPFVLIVKPFAPFNVLANETSPLLLVVNVVLSPNVTAPV